MSACVSITVLPCVLPAPKIDLRYKPLHVHNTKIIGHDGQRRLLEQAPNPAGGAQGIIPVEEDHVLSVWKGDGPGARNVR